MKYKIENKVMENLVDCVTVHSNCQESKILDHAQDLQQINTKQILTSPDREFETKFS